MSDSTLRLESAVVSWVIGVLGDTTVVESVLGWKNSCCKISEGLGLFLGLYYNIHSIKEMASLEARGTTLIRGILG